MQYQGTHSIATAGGIADFFMPSRTIWINDMNISQLIQ